MELTIELPSGETHWAVAGPAQCNLKMIRETLGVTLTARGDAVRINGDTQAVGRAAIVLEHLVEAAQKRQPMTRHEVIDAIAEADRHPSAGRMIPLDGRWLEVYLRGRRIEPKTPGQQAYVKALIGHDLTFCIGPAGTGKTYLAVAAAVSLLKRGDVRKLVLVRPAVEAGEKLGFLPGTMQDKVNPYLRPLLDALHDMMAFDQVERFMATDLIEIVPLAFMRGRTLNDACIICDEAQNTTRNQMLMFLTRLGHGSKMIITGDTSQIDLPDPRDSGLIDAVRRLRKTPGIAMLTLDGSDIVRHDLVQRIVEAYEPGQNPKPQAPEVQALAAAKPSTGHSSASE